MEFKIKGYSGCKVELIEGNKGGIVRKSTNSSSYQERLKKQAQKQRIFSTENTVTKITTPEIYSSENLNPGHAMEMEYCPSLDFISFFQLSPVSEIFEIAETLKEYIHGVIDQSELVPFPKEVIQVKLDEVKKLILADPSKEVFRPHLQFVEIFLKLYNGKTPFPVGKCHGDLTFSNILFGRDNKNLVFIDFLDNFLETPLQDMVKIRQDTQFQWSLLFLSDPTLETKTRIVLNKLDQIFDQFFSLFGFYKEYYIPFQTLNLLRIVPYTQSLEHQNTLLKKLNNFIKGIKLEEKPNHTCSRQII